MQRSLLTGDKISNYYAIGVDGSPIWQNANIFRDSIERTAGLGTKCSRFLATPKVNADKTYIDWYIPFASSNADGSYNIVSWESASEEEKAKALSDIRDLESRLVTYGKTLLARSIKGDQLIFAHLLCGADASQKLPPALHYPDNNHIYIVDGQVVITFWGFLHHANDIDKRSFITNTSNLNTATTSNLNNTSNFTSATQANENTAQVVDNKEDNKENNKHKCVFFLALPLCLKALLALLLLALLLGFLWWLLSLFKPSISLPSLSVDGAQSAQNLSKEDTAKTTAIDNVELDAQKDDVATLKDTTIQEQVIDKNKMQEILVESINTNLNELGEVVNDVETNAIPKDLNTTITDPIVKDSSATLTTANTIPTQNPVNTVNNTTDPNNINTASSIPTNINNTAISNKRLVLDQQKMINNDISFLNGVWNTKSGIMDASTGKPLNISYSFNNGDGLINIIRQDGVKCQANVNANIDKENLFINTEKNIVCEDNKIYNMPNVKCIQGADGKARCYAQKDGKNDFPIIMYEN